MNASDIKTNETIDYQNIFYPPGGILIWILILLELLTFGIALTVMVIQSKSEPQIFSEMSGKLNTLFGSINTVVLLTSGYFMAKSVHFFKEKKYELTKKFLIWTVLLGLVFVGIKSIEYTHKINEGITLGSNTFMNYYWLLTGFHLIHVLVGMAILGLMYHSISKKPEQTDVLDYEASASFWHLCDLIWLLLFPVLYLIF
jgi:nitric oxide reductase NorE protein